MIYDKQSQIGYEFTDMNGNPWANNWINTYNEFTRLINRHLVCDPDSLTQQERDFYLDQRHKHYVQCAAIAKKGATVY